VPNPLDRFPASFASKSKWVGHPDSKPLGLKSLHRGLKDPPTSSSYTKLSAAGPDVETTDSKDESNSTLSFGGFN